MMSKSTHTLSVMPLLALIFAELVATPAGGYPYAISYCYIYF